jgi:hypothetical protein
VTAGDRYQRRRSERTLSVQGVINEGAKEHQKEEDMSPRSYTGKTYYPSRRFEALLRELVDLAVKEGWAFTLIDMEAFKADADAQSQERRQLAALEAEYRERYEAFYLAQWDRFHRYTAVLNAARAAYRGDKDKLAALGRFQLATRRGKKNDADPGPKTEPTST